MSRPWRKLLHSALFAPLVVTPAAAGDVVLVTLDTTRADYLGAWGRGDAATPTLDRLAASGTRFERAITPSPLTLPAHASLMTGLIPPAHGVEDNGLRALPPDLPTLAMALRELGYATAAVVASAVLDHRFGLDRGFDHYDDQLTAELKGEYGYPERDAEAVTDAALSWAKSHDGGRPYFLWVHYYDPHSPYVRHAGAGESAEERYAAEIAFVDRELGRLLDSLPGAAEDRLVVVVGDHGEMLGEHGERAHGLLLYRASLEVPLIVSGPGVGARVVRETVGAAEVASSIVELAGGDSSAFGPGLPGLGAGSAAGSEVGKSTCCRPIYSEARLPATAYGWSPLLAVTDDRWRYVEAPRPELYDFVADPTESRNLVDERPELAAAMRGKLGEFATEVDPGAPAVEDGDLGEQLRALGYLSGMTGEETGTIDPKDAIAWLDEFEEAKRLLSQGALFRARAALDELVRRNPDNVPFLMRAADAQFATERVGRGLELLERALEINPDLDLLHLRMANARLMLRQWDAAEAAYRRALDRNPRLADAWLGLAQLAGMRGDTAEETRRLREAVESGTLSAGIFARLGQLALATGDLAAADRHLGRANGLVSTLAPAWWSWGLVAQRQGQPDLALERFGRALELNPADASARVYVGRFLLGLDRVEEARAMLESAVRVGGDSAAGREARRLLERPDRS